MPRIRKKTSGRVTTHQRSKIKHKVSETRKKKKKEAKKNPQWKSRRPKDPGIPSNYPFKEEVLAEAAEARRQAAEEKQRRKEERSAAKIAAKAAEGQTEIPTPSQRLEAESDSDSEAPALRDSSLPSLKEVLEVADVVLQVLDARDPLPFRSKWIEDNVRSHAGKQHGFILNKIDLIPREAAARWKEHLRVEAPTILFRASSKVLDVDTATTKRKVSNSQGTKPDPATGVDSLREVLGVWAKEKEGKEPLRVALVGTVNSGKSVIVNALKGNGRVPTYSRTQPGTGFATTPYPIPINIDVQGHIVEIIDTPGLMKQNEENQSEDIRVRDMLFRNKGKVDKVKNPLPAIQYITSRASAQDLMLLYSLPAFPDKDVNGFLRAVARARGFVQTRGDLDILGAAKSVLKDWASNKFPFYTLPPSQQVASPDSKDLNNRLQSIYQRFDQIALDTLSPVASLWAESGLVKFDPEAIDTREVILTPLSGGAGEDEVESDNDEQTSDEEDESALGSDEECEESASDEEQEPQRSSKRKREPAAPPERNVKPKKVTFAPMKGTPQPGKGSNSQTKGASGSGSNNPKKNGKATLTAADDEAYDFSKYF